MEKIKFILSDKLIKQLSKIDHIISDRFLEINNSDFLSKKSFIDLHPTKDGYLTFIQSNKATDLLNIDDSLNDDIGDDHAVYNTHRGDVKIGRFINEIFGNGTFPQAEPSNFTKKQSGIENFIRIFKSKYNTLSKFKLFNLVEGDDIKHWYHEDNYKSKSKGSLGDSCMSCVDDDFFDIYSSNDKVKLLLYHDKDDMDLIVGRALVWYLDKPVGRVYMERIYTNDSSDEQIFMEYATHNNWLLKSKQEYGTGHLILDTVNNKCSFLTLECELNIDLCYQYYPYLDTLQYYNANDDILSNKKNKSTHKLHSTEGLLCLIDEEGEEDDDNLFIKSNYHGGLIHKEDATWCVYGNDWVHCETAIFIYNSGGNSSVPNNDEICLSSMEGRNDKYFIKSECIYSDYLDTWVYKDSVIKVYKDKDKTEYVIDSIRRSEGNYYKLVDDEYYLLDVVI